MAQPSGAGGGASDLGGSGGVGGFGNSGTGGTTACTGSPPTGACGCLLDPVYYTCVNGTWTCPLGEPPRETCSCILGYNCPVDGVDGGSSTDCKKAWTAPGCGGQAPTPMCDDGKGGACGGAVCDCQNTVHLTYCDRSDVPFHYFLAGGTTQNEGDDCDPTPDAGPDH